MFSSLLIEGKEPPVIREIGESVLVTFLQREFDADFRYFVATESRKDRLLGIDELLLLQYLRQHQEVDTASAAGICQRSEAEIREKLSGMVSAGYLEHGGTGRGAYWCMSPDLYNTIAGDGNAEKRRRIDWEAAKTRVFSILMERSRRGDAGISNKEIRHITRYDRNQVTRMMKELRNAHVNLQSRGHGAGAVYEWLKD
jgi:ATP-dependent DNA helicase RecG